MIINLHQLKKIPVVTKSGIKLGKVNEINFLVDSQSVFQYIVRPSIFGGRTFVINAKQVLEISDRILVDDAVMSEKNLGVEESSQFANNKILGGVATSKVNLE